MAGKDILLRELVQAGLQLARGLVVLRDALVSKSERECIMQWAQGDYTDASWAAEDRYEKAWDLEKGRTA